MHRKRFAIVGAGISGVTAALNLFQQGHQVDIFDFQGIAGGVTSGSAGQIVKSFVDIRRMTEMGQLNPTELKLQNESLRQMLNQSTVAWHNLLAGTDLLNFLSTAGSVHIYEKGAEHNIKSDIAKRKAVGLRYEILNGQGLCPFVRGIVPNTQDYVGVLYPDNWQIIDVVEFCRRAIQIICAGGGSFSKREIVEVIDQTNGVKLVFDDQREFIFDKCVLALGNDFKNIWKRISPVCEYCDVILGEPGYSVRLRSRLPSMTPLLFRQHGVTVARQGQITYAFGSFDPRVCNASEILERVGSLKLEVDGPLKFWQRPSTVEGSPRIKTISLYGNVIATMGHGHLGVTLAAALAEEVCVILRK